MKSIWKLVMKCVCVMMPFVVLGCRMEQNMIAFVDGEATCYIWNREKTNTTQDKKYRVVVLGDSTANASYVPEALSQDAINLALGGATPAENYYTLREWLDYNPAPDVCYLSFTDRHLQLFDFFWTKTMYSHRYGLRENLEMLTTAIAYQESSILTEHYWLNFLSYQFYLPNKYITSFMNASFNQRYEDNVKAKDLDELHGGRYMARGTAECTKTDQIIADEFYTTPFFDDYYKKIIELCVEYNITPRIVKLPLPDNTQFTDHYEEMFYEYYEDLKNEYPSLTVDWFAKVYPKDCFVDTVHMNSHGALRFSTELKEKHPEDFSTTEMDDNQIAALNDSIRDENKIEWILKWIDGRDYTVLFYDKRGEFKDLYENQLKGEWDTEDLRLEKVSIKDPPKNEEDGDDADAKAELNTKKPEVWEILGIGESTSSASSSISVTLAENSLMLQLENQEPQAWATASDDMLGVAVVNNYNHSVVRMKSFRYVDEAFQLAQ